MTLLAKIIANAAEAQATHRRHSSSFLGLPYRILNNSKYEPQNGATWGPMGRLMTLMSGSDAGCGLLKEDAAHIRRGRRGLGFRGIGFRGS